MPRQAPWPGFSPAPTPDFPLTTASVDTPPFSMPATSSQTSMPPSSNVTMRRRVRGAVADELHLRCAPRDGAGSAAGQTESLYRELERLLAAEGFPASSLLTETLFLRDIAGDHDAVRDARRRLLGAAASSSVATFIGQPPLDSDAAVELAAVAVLPHAGQRFARQELCVVGSCSCSLCAAGSSAVRIEGAGQLELRAANVFGSGRGYDEAFEMFVRAEALLGEAGLEFRDVMRTWIHLRDIDHDYDALNRARRDFFRSRGIERRPASTGVQGIPAGHDHDFSLGFYALRATRPLEVPLMSTPTLNEAWTYGADFSRGLRLCDANKTTLHVSGTASIDEEGRSVHVGDFAAQTERMLRNIETLLEVQGASVADLVSAVTYLKNPGDAAELRRIFDVRGFGGFPLVVVDAPLCRPELLCETEAVAVLAHGA